MKSPHHRSLGRTLMIALVSATFLAAGVTPLSAQQAPPTWKQGQPDAMKDSQLAPVPQRYWLWTTALIVDFTVPWLAAKHSVNFPPTFPNVSAFSPSSSWASSSHR